MIPAAGRASASTSGSGVAKGRRSRWAMVRRALLAFLGTAVVGVVLWFVNVLDFHLATALVLALVVGSVVTLLSWVMSEDTARLKPAHWFATLRQESVRPAALDYRMLRLRRDLRDALERNDRTDEIYPVVRGLAAERLQARHDIDLDGDPKAAAAVMTPALTSYLSTPPTGTEKRSKRDLAKALDGIEEL